MPALQICPEPAEIDVAPAEDMYRFTGSVGEQPPEQVFAVDQCPPSAAAGPLSDFYDLSAALVEDDLGCRAAEGDAKRADAGAVKLPQGGIVQARGCGVKDAPANLVEVDAESGEQFAVSAGTRPGLDLGADRGRGDTQVHRLAQRLVLRECQEEELGAASTPSTTPAPRAV